MKTKEVMERYLKGKRLSKYTARNVKVTMERLADMFEEYPQSRVEINEFLNSLDGLSDISVRTRLSHLKMVGEFMENNYGLDNPTKGVEKIRIKKRQRRIFTADEIMRIFQACASEFELVLCMTLFDTPCRIGELAGMNVDDIGDGFVVLNGKTGERKYRLDERLSEKIKSMANGDKYPFGGVARVNALKARIGRICKRAGLEGKKLSAHTFRHSAGTLVAMQTKNVLMVQELLQHDRIGTSQEYIHIAQGEMVRDISPLKMLAEKVGVVKQEPLMLGDGEREREVEDNVVEEMMDLMPDIPEGASVRPLLKYEDLVLIKEVFERVGNDDRYSEYIGKCRKLMMRMVRKVRA